MFQSLLNRVLRGCVMSASYRKMDMTGVETMADMRLKYKQDTVVTILGKGRLGYLGHLSRYSDHRTEKRLFVGIVDTANIADIVNIVGF